MPLLKAGLKESGLLSEHPSALPVFKTISSTRKIERENYAKAQVVHERSCWSSLSPPGYGDAHQSRKWP